MAEVAEALCVAVTNSRPKPILVRQLYIRTTKSDTTQQVGDMREMSMVPCVCRSCTVFRW